MPGLIGRCGGGGAATRFSGEYGTNSPPSIANGSSARLPFNVLSQGDAVLDITTPTDPTVLATGYWDLNVEVVITSVTFTAGGSYTVFLEGDDNSGFGYQARITSAQATAAVPLPEVHIVIAGIWLTAGSDIFVGVINHDGASARSFGINAALISLVARG
jgi:hypothetical protein